MDSTGKVIFEFGKASDISYLEADDLFLLEFNYTTYALYDSNLQRLTSKNYTWINMLGNGLYSVGVDSNGKTQYGIYQLWKGEVLPCKYDRAWTTTSATGETLLETQTGANVGLYDSKGVQILPEKYQTIVSFYDNYIVVGQFADEKYRSLFPDGADMFSEADGELVVKLGVIDTDGNVVIPFEYNKIDFIKKTGQVALGVWNGKRTEKTGKLGELVYVYYYDITYVSIASLSSGSKFKDVKMTDYCYDAVQWGVENGITSGTSSTTFSPSTTCTNAQILTFIWRAAGSPEVSISDPFTNLDATAYYYKAALWAYENNMVSAGTFEADAPCTRAMAVTYLWQQAGCPETSPSSKFSDVSADSAYAAAVAWALDRGITTGTTETTFSPDTLCTRAQIITFLYRALSA